MISFTSAQSRETGNWRSTSDKPVSFSMRAFQSVGHWTQLLATTETAAPITDAGYLWYSSVCNAKKATLLWIAAPRRVWLDISEMANANSSEIGDISCHWSVSSSKNVFLELHKSFNFKRVVSTVGQIRRCDDVCGKLACDEETRRSDNLVVTWTKGMRIFAHDSIKESHGSEGNQFTNLNHCAYFDYPVDKSSPFRTSW